MTLRLLKQEDAEFWAAKAEKYLPRSRAIHGFLSIGLQRNIINLKEINFYVPVNETFPFFMFITGLAGTNDMPSCTPFWDPNEFEEDVLFNLLSSVPNWNWQTDYFLYLCNIPVSRQLENLILRPIKSLGGENMELRAISTTQEGYLFVINSIDKSKFKFPDDEYVLDFLHEDDAEHLFNNWIYKRYHSLAQVKQTLQVMPAIGAYVKQSGYLVNERQKPVSWAVSKHNGEIGMTNTLPEHRSKGLAGAVTLKLAEVLLDQGIIPMVAISSSNEMSINLHEKIGFEKEELSPICYHVYDLKTRVANSLNV